MQHREVGDLGGERVVDVEVLVVLRELVAVVLDHRHRVGATEEELGHRVAVDVTEQAGELDLLLALELLRREHQHAVLVQRARGSPRALGGVDRRRAARPSTTRADASW